jgi:acetyl-CoA carboxylase carboxyltransferase component
VSGREELAARQARIAAMGGADRIRRQHQAGKLTARERLDLLLDAGSFAEIGAHVTHRGQGLGLSEEEAPADGVVTGVGRVGGRTVYVYSQDFTVLGGSLGEMHAAKVGLPGRRPQRFRRRPNSGRGRRPQRLRRDF